MVVLLIVISFVIFLFLYLAPGSPEQILLGPRESTPDTVAAIRQQYHLDEPFLDQYLEWLEGAVRLDFGRSISTNEPVAHGIVERLSSRSSSAGSPSSSSCSWGCRSACSPPRGSELGSTAASSRSASWASSAPAFATGLLLLYVFAVRSAGSRCSGRGRRLRPDLAPGAAGVRARRSRGWA